MPAGPPFEDPRVRRDLVNASGGALVDNQRLVRLLATAEDVADLDLTVLTQRAFMGTGVGGSANTARQFLHPGPKRMLNQTVQGFTGVNPVTVSEAYRGRPVFWDSAGGGRWTVEAISPGGPAADRTLMTNGGDGILGTDIFPIAVIDRFISGVNQVAQADIIIRPDLLGWPVYIVNTGIIDVTAANIAAGQFLALEHWLRPPASVIGMSIIAASAIGGAGADFTIGFGFGAVDGGGLITPLVSRQITAAQAVALGERLWEPVPGGSAFADMVVDQGQGLGIQITAEGGGNDSTGALMVQVALVPCL